MFVMGVIGRLLGRKAKPLAEHEPATKKPPAKRRPAKKVGRPANIHRAPDPTSSARMIRAFMNKDYETGFGLIFSGKADPNYVHEGTKQDVLMVLLAHACHGMIDDSQLLGYVSPLLNITGYQIGDRVEKALFLRKDADGLGLAQYIRSLKEQATHPQALEFLRTHPKTAKACRAISA